MTIKSTITINMKKINKVSIASIVEDNTIEEELFDIEQFEDDSATLSLVNNLDDKKPRELAIYENELKIKDRAFDMVNEQIRLYKEILGEVANVIKHYDVRIERTN